MDIKGLVLNVKNVSTLKLDIVENLREKNLSEKSFL